MKQIEDLRDHLFATLEALSDKKNPMEISRAKAIAGVAQTMINSAKVEVDFMRVTGSKGSGFIPDEDKPPRLPAAAQQPGITVHKIK